MQIPLPDNERHTKTNPLNANFHKKEFQTLWNKINRKAAYTVHFDSAELIKKCIAALDKELKVSLLSYTVTKGQQLDDVDFNTVKSGDSFVVKESKIDTYYNPIHSAVKYDLIGKVAEGVQLTRVTVAAIFQGINKAVFDQFKTNPEEFIAKSIGFINEQKATMIVEHIAYDPIDEVYEQTIFTKDKAAIDFSRAIKAEHHIYDYVVTDSEIERKFAKELDTSAEVVVYAKLPKAFFIPTPVGNYNPDWAISFQQDKVKHVYFVAETKGSMSSMDLRKIEECKIDCARKFFAKITSEQVKYDIVNNYEKLIELVS